MTILVHLNDLRAGFPACRAVVYCDLSTGMVLSSSSHQRWSQEHLDQLGQIAFDVLNCGPDFPSNLQSVILVQGDTINLVIRSPDQTGEALSCECNLDLNLADFCVAAKAVLVGTGALT